MLLIVNKILWIVIADYDCEKLKTPKNFSIVIQIYTFPT